MDHCSLIPADPWPSSSFCSPAWVGIPVPEIVMTQGFARAVPLSGTPSLFIFMWQVPSHHSDFSLNITLFQYPFKYSSHIPLEQGLAHHSPRACHLFLWMQFYSSFLYISSVAPFILQQVSCVAMTEPIWPTKPKIFTLWIVRENVCRPCPRVTA